jgi:acyl-CoA thioester hydrolase
MRDHTYPTTEMSIARETYRGVVYPWEMDHMGHLNVQFYTRRFDEASWHFLAQAGATPSYLRDERRGVVAKEQRISYAAEVTAGALVLVRSSLVEIGRSSMRYRHTLFEVVDRETERPLAEMELLVVQIDADRRVSCPWPEAVVDWCRNEIAAVE